MIELSILIEILEKSVEKNGEKPLTNLWLLNIMKMASREKSDIDKEAELLNSEFDFLN
jgi:hypothetical protein